MIDVRKPIPYQRLAPQDDSGGRRALAWPEAGNSVFSPKAIVLPSLFHLPYYPIWGAYDLHHDLGQDKLNEGKNQGQAHLGSILSTLRVLDYNCLWYVSLESECSSRVGSPLCLEHSCLPRMLLAASWECPLLLSCAGSPTC